MEKNSHVWDVRCRLTTSAWAFAENGSRRVSHAPRNAIELEGLRLLRKRKLLGFYADIAELSKILIKRGYRHVFGCSGSGD